MTPGLIDLHNHLAYNTLPLWSAPREQPYTSRHQWPSAATYGRDISNPLVGARCVAAGRALRYAEVRVAVGRGDVDPGLAAGDADVPRLDGPQPREEQIPAFGKDSCCSRR